MKKIGQYCLDFADKNGLEAYSDSVGNVVILKPASKGYEDADTVMLQGHMDIVCQKEAELAFDFNKLGTSSFIISVMFFVLFIKSYRTVPKLILNQL